MIEAYLRKSSKRFSVLTEETEKITHHDALVEAIVEWTRRDDDSVIIVRGKEPWWFDPSSQFKKMRQMCRAMDEQTEDLLLSIAGESVMF